MSTDTDSDGSGLADQMRSSLALCWSEAMSLVATEGKLGAFQSLAADNRAQGAGNLVSLVIGVMIAAIVVMQVFIPVVNDANSNLSGTEQTIADLLPLFGVLLVMIALAAPLMRRV